jgi:hypothetical protein
MKPKTESGTVSLTVIGVDIGEEVFHLVGLGADGKIAFRGRRVREAAAEYRWHGSLPKRALRQQDAARIGARAARTPDYAAVHGRAPCYLLPSCLLTWQRKCRTPFTGGTEDVRGRYRTLDK